MQSCINFGQIKIELPANLSKVTGFYKDIDFEFNDVTIKVLGFDLKNWVKTATAVELSEMNRIRLVMELPAATIKYVSPRVLANFEEQFPKEYFQLALEKSSEKNREAALLKSDQEE